MEGFKWLGKKEEVEFEQHEFKGKGAGKAWKYTQNLNGLIRTRVIIFLMALLMFYPIITNFLFHDVFFAELFIARLVYAGLLVLAGVLFNRYRFLAIGLASIAILLAISDYLLSETYDVRQIGALSGVLILILSGIYHHIQLKKLRKELEASLVENQLIG